MRKKSTNIMLNYAYKMMVFNIVTIKLCKLNLVGDGKGIVTQTTPLVEGMACVTK